jgi:hypothetical protein
MGRWSYAPSIIEGVPSMIGGGECYSSGYPWLSGCEVGNFGPS